MNFQFFPRTRRAWRGVTLRLTFFVALPIGVLLRIMIAMPGETCAYPQTPLTPDQLALAERFGAHVRSIASREHNTLHPKELEASALYLEAQLTDMGYAVARQIFECEVGPVRNIEVEVPGSGASSEIVVVGAHYDSARGAPGANDNGSGVAMVLELARRFRDSHPNRTIRFVLFVNEEPPYYGSDFMGSRVYAKRSRERNENITAMISLETVGCFSEEADSQRYPSIFRPFYPTTGNFIGFVGDLRSRRLVHRAIATFRGGRTFPSEGIASFPWIVGINWSDHAAFWAYGYRGLMITDTAPFRYSYYHTAADTPERVNVQAMARLFGGVCDVVADLADR